MTLPGCGAAVGSSSNPGGQAVTEISSAMRGVRFLAPSAAIAALALLAVGGCSSGGSTSGSAKESASSPSSPVGQTYASKAFAVPLTITVPASFFKAQPNSDTSTFLTWFTGSIENEGRFHRVRFLLPVALYRPGQTAPEKPPKDYLTYLRGLSGQGATLADEKKITVDGHSATLMTVTTEQHLDGVFGCPQTQGVPDAGGDCYGVQPEGAVRIAVIDVSGRTLVAWAGINKGASDESAFFAEFEAMLKSVQFR
jgi:hypothetical protein